jgi:hypothetical protein
MFLPPAPTWQDITGKEPKTMEQWIVEHAAAFAPALDGSISNSTMTLQMPTGAHNYTVSGRTCFLSRTEYEAFLVRRSAPSGLGTHGMASSAAEHACYFLCSEQRAAFAQHHHAGACAPPDGVTPSQQRHERAGAPRLGLPSRAAGVSGPPAPGVRDPRRLHTCAATAGASAPPESHRHHRELLLG